MDTFCWVVGPEWLRPDPEPNFQVVPDLDPDSILYTWPTNNWQISGVHKFTAARLLKHSFNFLGKYVQYVIKDPLDHIEKTFKNSTDYQIRIRYNPIPDGTRAKSSGSGSTAQTNCFR